jgi:uncharacterized lipoprotein YmbA
MTFTMTQRRLFVTGPAGLMMALALVMTGCGGEPEATPPPPTGSNAAPDVSQYAPKPDAQVQPQKLDLPADANADAVLAELNYQLKRWIVSNQRRPANFEEFVNSAQIQVPPPPPGKKYEMGPQVKIVLVDR